MKIIIDLRPLLYNCISEEARVFIMSSLDIISKENIQQDWFFLVDQLYEKQKNINIEKKKLSIKKSIQNKLGWQIWYGWQIPDLIKKYKIDLLITTGGITSSASVPQCVWMPLIIENSNRSNKNYFSFYKKRLQQTLQKAQTVFIFSEKNKQQFINDYKITPEKLTVTRSAPEAVSPPLLWTEKENIKVKYAGGKEYFIITGSLQNDGLINVLKAFSQFKKRQQSNMQLVIAVENINKNISFLEKLESYKYKTDVHISDEINADEIIKIIATAYALIYPAHEGNPGTIILNALKSGVPVITNDAGCSREIAADAVLYADINNHESLSNQLMLLYKNETLRNQLIEKGKIQVQQFNNQQTNTQILNGILKAVNK
jgi:glycosyltransferase involved in cell wall biosynthesis